MLSILLTLPALGVGWMGDDFWHRAVLLRPAGLEEVSLLRPRSDLDLFRFLDGDPGRGRLGMDLGLLPWWSWPGIRGAFWRPLTSLTHWLDHRLWPGSAVLMHAHSVVWLAAVSAAASLLYRRVMGATVAAGLAALLYAADDARGMPVGFLANRNALIAAFFCVLTILAHLRWRRDGWRPGALLAPALLALSLLSAEAGVATLAYLVAFAAFLDRGRWIWRTASLVPYVVQTVLWRLAWKAMGYGISPGIDFYVDPAAEPWRFLVAVLERGPVLLLDQWALPPSELYLILEGGYLAALWTAAVVFLSLCAAVIVPRLRDDAAARFWALGMLLAVVPSCSAFPSGRLLLFVGLGAFGLVGQFLSPQAASAEGVGRSPSARVLAVILVTVHAVFSPLFLLWRSANPTGPKRMMNSFYVRLPADESVRDQDVVVLNPPMAMFAGFVLPMRALEGLPLPRHVRVLGPSLQAVDLTRLDERRLLLRSRDGYLRYAFDQLFRPRHRPFAPGDRVELTGMTAEITSLTPDGRPAEVTFRFAVPLEDPSLRWLRWDDASGRFVTFTPPPVGQTMKLSSGALMGLGGLSDSQPQPARREGGP